MSKIFVYGTLRKGCPNHKIFLWNADYLGDYITPACFTMYRLPGFPAVTFGGETSIKGEVYEVSQDEFKAIDGLEGYPRFYDRIEIETPYGLAWMYFFEGPKNEFCSELIESGDWCDR